MYLLNFKALFENLPLKFMNISIGESVEKGRSACRSPDGYPDVGRE
jgi:hypothetical protein